VPLDSPGILADPSLLTNGVGLGGVDQQIEEVKSN